MAVSDKDAAALPLPVLIEPSIQRYAWGDPGYLPRFLGMAEDGAPWAEAWFGAHPAAPAKARVGHVEQPLDRLIEDRNEALLGASVARRYGGLPYLLKVLACAKPLSIQVHPDRAQAADGYAREEAAGIARDASVRCYPDPNHKPELFVAWTEFHALAGFRHGDDLTAALGQAPELAALLPAVVPDAAGLRTLLDAWFALPDERVEAALRALLGRLEAEDARQPFASDCPAYWALRAHRELSADGRVDRGLLLVFLLGLVTLQPGQAIFLPAGVPHAYLEGAGLELMASSDNVLRAGLTPKHVDAGELLRIVRFDAEPPPVLTPVDDASGLEASYPVPAEELDLRIVTVRSARPVTRRANGPETVLARSDAEVIVTCGETRIALERGRACLIPSGASYRLESTADAHVFVASTPDDSRPGPARQPDPVDRATSRALGDRVGLGDSSAAYAVAVMRNIETTRALFADGEPPHVVGTVCGSAAAQIFWQAQLDAACAGLGARDVISLHEDLPVNQAFGLLLAWQRLRPIVGPRDGALIAFVFGEGTRAAPFTEAECGQKPALASFVMDRGATLRPLSIVELALRTFAPVEAYLRRSGFSGVVFKWGDEVQIPTLDLGGADPRFADADVVRFVSMRPMAEDDARNKDWVGIDRDGRVTRFIPRRPLAQMQSLADQGLLQRRDGRLFGGINLGSIAVSRDLLDALLEEFADEVNDPAADRSRRPDLDPQLFTALTIAAVDDASARESAWQSTRAESSAMEKLAADLPGVLDRLRGILERFRERHGRAVSMLALDFGDQYWGDIGQHRQMHDLYMALAEPGVDGEIARALAGIGGRRDAAGNLIAGATRLGPGVEVRDSVLVDARIDAGRIEGSVLIGTRAGTLHAEHAFDVMSTASSLELAPRAGSYKVVSESPVAARAGERVTTVFLNEVEHLLRVHEDTDLRDRNTSYDVPILGNPLSFRDAHEQVVRADPKRIEARRAAKRREVEGSLGD